MVDRLNGRLIAFANDGAFARHSDWRLATMQELQLIVEPQAPGRINGARAPRRTARSLAQPLRSVAMPASEVRL